MSSIQNIDISLQEIVKNIAKDTYLIPKFQRDFVWTMKDISDLGDSIIRGYPISSLLIMPENGTLKVGYHSLIKDDSLTESRIPTDESDSKNYILDGQQRMTSIAKLFLSCDQKYEYYFDLLAILVEKFPEDKIENDSGLQNNKSLVADTLCRSFHRGLDKSDKLTRQNNRFISGKSIIDNKFGSVVSKFLRNLKDAKDENIDKYTDHLNAVLGSIGGYSIPATVIAGDSELGIVIRVFEKVNSTGKKLTLFDLINAKSFQVDIEAYKGGLSDFLTNKLYERSKNDHFSKNGINKFFKYDETSDSYEKLDKIVRILELCHLLENEQAPSIFQSTMLGKDPEFWFDTWIKKSEILFDAIKWLDNENLLDVGQTTFIEYATAIFLANPSSFNNQKFRQEIKKYSLYLTIADKSFSKSNLDIVEKFFSISKTITNSHEFEKYNYTSPSKSISLTSNNVLEFTTSKSGFRAILNILYIEKPENKFNRDILGNRIDFTQKQNHDHHHIFPKSRVTDFNTKSYFNSIANIILIDSQSNREEIKDKTPSEYFRHISQLNDSKNLCEQNLIDINAVSTIQTESQALLFISARAEKIASIINSYFND